LPLGRENALSQPAHRSLGFVETERVVYFNMALSPKNGAWLER
jgi:hypothetical protein